VTVTRLRVVVSLCQSKQANITLMLCELKGFMISWPTRWFIPFKLPRAGFLSLRWREKNGEIYCWPYLVSGMWTLSDYEGRYRLVLAWYWRGRVTMTSFELQAYLEHENYKLSVNMESKIIKQVSLYTNCQVISSIDDSVSILSWDHPETFYFTFFQSKHIFILFFIWSW
jgi:hypothetical protein